MATGESRPALSVVIPAWNEAENLARLLPDLHATLPPLGLPYELLVADPGSRDGTAEVCAREGARLLDVGGRGYGRALRAAFAEARGGLVVTMDADLSHPSEFVRTLLERRGDADVVVASRYVPGGSAEQSAFRTLLSRLLNALFRTALGIPVRDLSSGFRLYRAGVLPRLRTTAQDFDVLLEILIVAHLQGCAIREIPFHYGQRGAGSTHVRLLAFARQYLLTFRRLWRLRYRS